MAQRNSIVQTGQFKSTLALVLYRLVYMVQLQSYRKLKYAVQSPAQLSDTHVK